MNKKERHVVLVNPEIHWNTGNIGRTCLGAGAHLHLIEPIGFSLDSKFLKRAGLDYWSKIDLNLWKNIDELMKQKKPTLPEIFLFSRFAKEVFWGIDWGTRAFLFFGSETKGLPDFFKKKFEKRAYRIPTTGPIRSTLLKFMD